MIQSHAITPEEDLFFSEEATSTLRQAISEAEVWARKIGNEKHATLHSILKGDRYGLLAFHMISIDRHDPDTDVLIGHSRHVVMIKIVATNLEYRANGDLIYRRRSS